jgi:hypothetical protein
MGMRFYLRDARLAISIDRWALFEKSSQSLNPVIGREKNGLGQFFHQQT